MDYQQSSEDKQDRHQRSYLFTVRIWPEVLADGRTEWRGQVRVVTGGETRYFREWSTLVDFFESVLSKFNR